MQKFAIRIEGLELLLCLGLCVPLVLSSSMLLEDLDMSGGDLEYSGSGDWMKEYETEVKTLNMSAGTRPSMGLVHPQASPELENLEAKHEEGGEVQVLPAAEPPARLLPEDTDYSGEGSESGDGVVVTLNPLSSTTSRRVFDVLINEDKKVIPDIMTKDVSSSVSDDIDLTFDLTHSPVTTDSSFGSLAKSRGLLEKTEVLTGVVAGGLVALVLAIMLVSFMVYRLKKKDEGCCDVTEQKHVSTEYQKPQRQEEFLA